MSITTKLWAGGHTGSVTRPSCSNGLCLVWLAGWNSSSSPSTWRQREDERSPQTPHDPVFTQTQEAFTLFNCGFPLQSPRPCQPILCNHNIYFTSGVLAKHYVMWTSCNKVPIQMDGGFSSCRFDLSRENLPTSAPEYKRDNGTICNHITSKTAQDRWLCGTSVSSTAALSLLTNATRVWGLLLASRDVLSAQLGTENMSDPVLDQSSCHCLSVREDKMHTVTSGCWLLVQMLQTPLRHLCYLCHHPVSFMRFSPLTSLFLSFFHCELLRKPWIGDQTTLVPVNPHRGEKVVWKQDVRTWGCVCGSFTYSGMWIHAEICLWLCQTK